MKKRFLAIALCAALFAAAMPLGVSAFWDVDSEEWYGEYIDKVSSVGVIQGYEDGSFRPFDQVKRGEFLKMVFEAAIAAGGSGFRSTTERDNIHWAGKYYTMAMDNNVLVSDVYEGGIMFPCTYWDLEQPISRYEMAVILTNICTNVSMEKTVVVTAPEDYIPDYWDIRAEFVNAVEQSYGKGLLTGDENGNFNGDDNLRRSEAAAVIYRYLWGGELAPFAERPEVQWVETPIDFVPFAVQYQSMSETERRLALFGDANKSYFSSAAEAAPFMETVTVPIWTLDSFGNKISSSTSVTVHYLVAKEIRLIFEEIYNDPEQFPIYGGWSIGGSRYTDTMRHSWGCAIDINAFYNCECTTNWNTGSTRVTCGYGWWPEGSAWSTFSGSMSGPSPYSIAPGSSVVRAFAKYGWGWGGQGYSLKSDGSQKFDYMHFSILPSGG